MGIYPPGVLVISRDTSGIEIRKKTENEIMKQVSINATVPPCLFPKKFTHIAWLHTLAHTNSTSLPLYLHKWQKKVAQLVPNQEQFSFFSISIPFGIFFQICRSDWKNVKIIVSPFFVKNFSERHLDKLFDRIKAVARVLCKDSNRIHLSNPQQ